MFLLSGDVRVAVVERADCGGVVVLRCCCSRASWLPLGTRTPLFISPGRTGVGCMGSESGDRGPAGRLGRPAPGPDAPCRSYILTGGGCIVTPAGGACPESSSYEFCVPSSCGRDGLIPTPDC